MVERGGEKDWEQPPPPPPPPSSEESEFEDTRIGQGLIEFEKRRMAQTSRLEESGLLTTEPHHVPGYGGFCPQFKFRHGKTYGNMTSSLMNDEEVVSFGKDGLADTVPKATRSPARDVRDYLITSRKGDVKFADMIPGYAGYVPCTKNYFGSRFREVCTNSIADLEIRKRKADHRKQELELIKAVQDGKIRLDIDEEDLPEYLALSPRRVPTSQTRQPILPSDDKAKPIISPYDLDNPDPNKTFKSGYTGFIPRSRDLLGQGYPLQSNKALRRFDEDRYRKQVMTTYHQPQGQGHLRSEVNILNTTMDHPMLTPSPPLLQYHHQQQQGQQQQQQQPFLPLYPEEAGMTPRYAGHVPGVRFRHGLTFGKSTKNTKNFQMPDVSM